MKSHDLLRDAWEDLHAEAQPNDVQTNPLRKAELARRLSTPEKPVHWTLVGRWLLGKRHPTLNQGSRLAWLLGIHPSVYLSARLAERGVHGVIRPVGGFDDLPPGLYVTEWEDGTLDETERDEHGWVDADGEPRVAVLKLPAP